MGSIICTSQNKYKLNVSKKEKEPEKKLDVNSKCIQEEKTPINEIQSSITQYTTNDNDQQSIRESQAHQITPLQISVPESQNSDQQIENNMQNIQNFDYPQQNQIASEQSEVVWKKYLEIIETIKNFQKEFENSLKMQKALVNQDLVIPIGVTGVGKSTYTSSLYGINMKFNQNNELVFDFETEQNFTEIGFKMKAETKSINSFKAKNGFFVCDIPGLLDNRSFVQDIINSLVTYNTIAQAKSVRFIIMVAPEQFSLQCSRGDIIRKISQQFVHLFRDFYDHKDSIVLVFNHIRKQEQSKKEKEAVKNLGLIKDEIQDPTEKKFYTMLIEKISDEIHLCFFPGDSDKEDHLNKIQNAKEINQNTIKESINLSLANSSLNELKLHLRECIDAFEICMKDSILISYSNDILSSISYLNQQFDTLCYGSKKILDVREAFSSLKNKLEQKENLLGGLKDSIKEFIDQEQFNKQKCEEVTQIISQILHFYYLIEMNKNCKIHPKLKLQDFLEQLNNNIFSKLEEQYLNTKNQNILFKLNCAYKLYSIFEYNNIKNIYSLIKEKLECGGGIQKGFQFYSKVKNYLTHQYIEASAIIKDTLQTLKLDIKIKLKNGDGLFNVIQSNQINLSLIKQNLTIISKDFKDQISELINKQKNINNTYYNLSQSNDFSQNLSKLIDKYKFIKFIYEDINLNAQFHDIEGNFNISEMENQIKNTLIIILKNCSKNQDLNQLIQNEQSIQILINADSEIDEYIKKEDIYIEYEKNINNLLSNLIDKSQKQLQSHITYLKNFVENTNEGSDNQKILDDSTKKVFDDLEKTIQETLQVKKKFTDFVKYKLIQQSLQQIEDLCNNFYTELEKSIERNVFRTKIIKKLLILVVIIKSLKQKSDQQQYINTGRSFIQTVRGFILLQINIRETNQNDFTLSLLEQLIQQIKILQNYQSFLNDFTIYLSSDLQILELEVNEKLEDSKQKSIIQDIKNESIIVENTLKGYRPKIAEKFKLEYQICLLNMNGISEQETQKQIEILDILQQLQQGNNNFNNIFFEENKYAMAQEKVLLRLQTSIEDFRKTRMNDKKYKYTQKNINILKFELQKIKGQKNHIPHDHQLLVIAKEEERRLQAQIDQLNEVITNQINQHKFSDVLRSLENSPDQEKDYAYQIMSNESTNIQNEINDKIEQFQKNPSFEIQEAIIKYQEALKDLYDNFGSKVTVILESVKGQMIQYFLILIEQLFDNLNLEEDKIVKFEKLQKLLEQFLSNKNRIHFDQNEFLLHFKQQVAEKYQQVQYSIKDNYKKRIDIFPLLKILKQLDKLIEDLKINEYLNQDQNIQDELEKTKKQFISYTFKQTKRYILSHNSFNEEDMESHLNSHFSQVSQFFKLKDQDAEQRKLKFKNEVKQIINQILAEFQSEDFNRIHKISEQYKFCEFVKFQIKHRIAKISTNLTIFLQQEDYRSVEVEIKKLQGLKQYFRNDEIYNLADHKEKEINQKIKEIFQFLDNDDKNNLNYLDKIEQVIGYISKILKIIDTNLGDQFEFQNKQKKLIKMMKDTMGKYINQIKDSVNYQNSNDFLKYQYQFNKITSVKVKFYDKFVNYIELFQFLLKSVKDRDSLDQQCEQILLQLQKMHIFYENIIIQKKDDLFSYYKILYSEKQFKEIIKIQQIFENFFRQINHKVSIREFDIRFIFTDILLTYEKYYEQSKQICEKQPINLQNLSNFEILLEEIEINFMDQITSIKSLKYSVWAKEQIEKSQKEMINSSTQLIQQFNQENKIEEFCRNLIEVQRYSENKPDIKNDLVQLIKKVINYFIQTIFQKYKYKQAFQCGDFNQKEKLKYHLHKDEVGNKLINENSDLLKGINNEHFKTITKEYNNFDKINKELVVVQPKKDIKFCKENFKKQFSIYEDYFNLINDQITLGKLNLQKLTTIIIDKSNEFKSKYNYLQTKEIQWNSEQKNHLIELLAHLSAAWTLLDCEQNSSHNNLQSQNMRLIHNIQITTIMRLLNIDQSQTSQVHNHVVQVRTGEGKSIALGITSSMFALIGFSIDCCCYSQQLSQRDFEDFYPFFKNFNIQTNIQYNTFGNLIEKILNNPFDLRQLGEKYLNQTTNQLIKSEQKIDQNKILLIDEMDFFFSESFLGQVYSVSCKYTNTEVQNLFKLIWKKKYNNSFTIQDVYKQKEYQILFEKYPHLNPLKKQFENKVKQMFEESKQMENHSYIFDYPDGSSEMEVGYKEFDNKNFNIRKGYKTSFAYMQEYETKDISLNKLNKNLFLTFNLGCYSYLQMISCYNLILGVTGTLETMTQFQKEYMKILCNINKETITPSIFGQCKLQFNPKQDVCLCQTIESFHNKIIEQIDSMMNSERAVIVFFENNQQLKSFYQYSQKIRQYNQVQILTEISSDKKLIISRAGYSKYITLSTKEFGRGTDFKQYDRKSIDKGGIHSIQTFLSETYAEQVQIMGRSARNGLPGSYSQILLQSDIKKSLNLKDTSCLSKIERYDIYEYLDKQRNKVLKQKNKQLKNQQKEAEKYHKKSLKMKQLLEKCQKISDEVNKELKDIAVYGDSKDTNVVQSFDHQQLPQDENEQKQQRQQSKKDKNELEIYGDIQQYQNTSVLIGQFCTDQWFLKSNLQQLLEPSLQKIGIRKVDIVTDEKIFANGLQNYDQAWVFSNDEFNNPKIEVQQEFIESIKVHLRNKKGLLILADNDPFIVHANLILQNIPIGYDEQEPVYMQMVGEDPGQKILKEGCYNKKQQFGKHPLTKGLKILFEGSTICYPEIQNKKQSQSSDDFYDISIIGTSSALKPCIFALNGNNKRGRIAFDCGLTKVHEKYWKETPGTEIYFQNCYQWLCFQNQKDN